MLRHVALVSTDGSEELSVSFIRVTRICELRGTLAVTSNRRTLRRNTEYKVQEPHGVTSQKTPFFFAPNLIEIYPKLSQVMRIELLVSKRMLTWRWGVTKLRDLQQWTVMQAANTKRLRPSRLTARGGRAPDSYPTFLLIVASSVWQNNRAAWLMISPPGGITVCRATWIESVTCFFFIFSDWQMTKVQWLLKCHLTQNLTLRNQTLSVNNLPGAYDTYEPGALRSPILPPDYTPTSAAICSCSVSRRSRDRISAQRPTIMSFFSHLTYISGKSINLGKYRFLPRPSQFTVH
jgi:hypothetical protein